MERFETLTPLEFSASVERTANSGIDQKNVVDNCSVSLVEELGEFAGVIKKWKYHGHELDLNKVQKELGDILFYCFWMTITMTNDPQCMTFSQLFSRDFKSQLAAIPGGSEQNLAQQFYHAQEDLGRILSTGFAYTANRKLGYDTYRFKQMIEIRVFTFLRALTAICCNLGFEDLHWGHIAHLNQQKLMKRYPDGFSSKDSRERVE